MKAIRALQPRFALRCLSGPMGCAALALCAALLPPSATAGDCVDYADYLPVVGSVSFPGVTEDVALAGSHAYLAAGVSDLRVVDISNPAAPASIGGVDTPGNALGLDVVGNLAYVVDGAFGLQIVDITNPAAPAIIGNLNTLAVPGGWPWPAPWRMSRTAATASSPGGRCRNTGSRLGPGVGREPRLSRRWIGRPPDHRRLERRRADDYWQCRYAPLF